MNDVKERASGNLLVLHPPPLTLVFKNPNSWAVAGHSTEHTLPLSTVVSSQGGQTPAVSTVLWVSPRQHHSGHVQLDACLLLSASTLSDVFFRVMCTDG